MMKTLKDLDFSRPIEHRLWMVLMLLATSVLVAGFAPALIAILALAYNQRERLSEEIRVYLSLPRKAITAALILIIPLIVISHGGNPPFDDLLRHVASWQHGYDYRDLYAGLDPRFPAQSMWIGFEWATGKLHEAFGYWPAIYIVQATAYTLTVWLAFALAKKFIPETAPSRDYWVYAVVILLLCAGMIQRAYLARPEVFLALWGMSALVMPAGRWAVIGAILMPSYWLSIIYLPTVLLLKETLRVRIAIGVLLAALFLVFWLSYAGIEWANFFLLVKDWSATRLLCPGEGNPIQASLFNPIFILATGLFLFRSRGFKPLKNIPLLLVICWFLLPSQVRYLGIVAPLILVVLISTYDYHRLSTTAKALGLFLAALLLIDAAPSKSRAQATIPVITFPENSKLLSEFDVPVYFLPTINPTLQVAPSMEVGSVKPKIQSAILALSGAPHPLRCETLKAEGFTHVIERHLAKAPPCLSLFTTHNEWRVWHVKP